MILLFLSLCVTEWVFVSSFTMYFPEPLISWQSQYRSIAPWDYPAFANCDMFLFVYDHAVYYEAITWHQFTSVASLNVASVRIAVTTLRITFNLSTRTNLCMPKYVPQSALPVGKSRYPTWSLGQSGSHKYISQTPSRLVIGTDSLAQLTNVTNTHTETDTQTVHYVCRNRS